MGFQIVCLRASLKRHLKKSIKYDMYPQYPQYAGSDEGTVSIGLCSLDMEMLMKVNNDS